MRSTKKKIETGYRHTSPKTRLRTRPADGLGALASGDRQATSVQPDWDTYAKKALSVNV